MSIKVRELTKTYQLGSTAIHALYNVNFEVMPGELLAIMGPSGSGKSTMLNLLGCLDTPSSGQYILEGNDVSHLDDDRLSEIRNSRIGFVFQNFNLLPRLSALENVALPLVYLGAKNARQRAAAALENVGLLNRAAHCSNKLSGGECQRVAIARAMATEPALILADEPTGNLDSRTGQEILRLFVELNQKGTTIILVTHDSKVAETARRIIHLKDGQITQIEEL